MGLYLTKKFSRFQAGMCGMMGRISVLLIFSDALISRSAHGLPRDRVRFAILSSQWWCIIG